MELLGRVGVGLTLFTYSQTTMLPLRLSAMCANFFFILWSLSTDVVQTLVLHVLLLPFNAYRL